MRALLHPISFLTSHRRWWQTCCGVALAFAVVLAGAGCDSADPGDDDGGGGHGGGEEPTEPVMLNVSGDIQHVHDPVLIEGEDQFYLFSTGPGILMRCSTNYRAWNSCGSVLDGPPQWALEAVPGVTALWAPDVIYFNDRYHLYYSASTFGSNVSAIGLATTPTLDQSSEAYGWTDQGMVIRSQRGNNYNAIDPNIVIDQDGTPWMSFGSYWSGIKMVELDAATGKPVSQNPQIYALAARPDDPAIEAPFITFRDGYYYLFVSWDRCCAGVESTYNIRVGRSESVTGPYVDQRGQRLTEGGGTLLMSSTERWRGPGHQAIFEEDGQTYLVYHAYDAFNDGVPTLRISPLVWEDGWPSVEMR